MVVMLQKNNLMVTNFVAAEKNDIPQA